MTPRPNPAIALALSAALALSSAGCSSEAAAPNMQTAAEATALLDMRGFDSGAAEACYSENGAYIDSVKVSQGAEGSHPYYSLYYTDSSGDVWVVYDMGGQVTARLFGTGTWLSEQDHITDYDPTANEFYSLSGGDNIEVVQVEKVSTEALDAYEIG